MKSILNKKPVYIRGNSKGGGAGHQWLLDGYKEIFTRYYYADYYFDEYGKFNAENRYVDYVTNEYVHGNMGWDYQAENDYWVHRNVYKFGDTDYCNKIYFIAYIKPINN